ncbi:hypothetical protein ROTO_00860 [Roseovarius tolerans]|jgi:hypothetical protein|uniref:Uncharacterized protein n=1 Tax=Roseovarius tolerans TaxID=74031 RepID=A0A0L6CZP1_9RHOB|nr:hypothetical protein ROTO_00860 [Roseovarius tolerans]
MSGLAKAVVILGLDPRICGARDPLVKPEDDRAREGLSR